VGLKEIRADSDGASVACFGLRDLVQRVLGRAEVIENLGIPRILLRECGEKLRGRGIVLLG
jgi:hypothetical protein